MSKQTINIGTAANSRNGDSLRAAFQKVNANFTELYTALGLDTAPLNLGAFTFTDSVISTEDSSNIVIDRPTTINGELVVDGDIIPDTDVAYDLGSATNRFRDLYLSGSTIDLGGTTLSVANGVLQIGGTSIGDVVKAAFTGGGPGEFTHSVVEGEASGLGGIAYSYNGVSIGVTANPVGDFNTQQSTVQVSSGEVLLRSTTEENGDPQYTSTGELRLNSSNFRISLAPNTNWQGELTFDENEFRIPSDTIVGEGATLRLNNMSDISIPTTRGQSTFNLGLVSHPQYTYSISAINGNEVTVTHFGGYPVPQVDWVMYDPLSNITTAYAVIDVIGNISVSTVTLADGYDYSQLSELILWDLNQFTDPWQVSISPTGELNGITAINGVNTLTGIRDIVGDAVDQWSYLISPTESGTITNMAFGYFGEGGLQNILNGTTSINEITVGPLGLPNAPIINTTVSEENALAIDLNITSGTSGDVSGNVTIGTSDVGTKGKIYLTADVDINSAGTITNDGDDNLQLASANRVNLQAGGVVNISADASEWQFDTDGALIFPNGAVIKDSADSSISFGVGAGATNQGASAVAIGEGAGNNTQSNQAIALGRGSGNYQQGVGAVGVGFCAGATEQGDYAVAIGFKAARGNMDNDGTPNQPANSIMINASSTPLNGNQAGLYINPVREDTSNTTKVIYYNTTTKELTYADLTINSTEIALGQDAGATNQSSAAVAVGAGAGQLNQGPGSIAIGNVAGNVDQGIGSLAVGSGAGGLNQGDGAIAIGNTAGVTNQGNYAIAIGAGAGSTDQPANSIIINANNAVDLDAAVSGLFINPVREDTGNTTKAIYYNTTTKELTYANPTGGGGDGANLVSDDDINITINSPDSTSYSWNFNQLGRIEIPDVNNQVAGYIGDIYENSGLVLQAAAGGYVELTTNDQNVGFYVEELAPGADPLNNPEAALYTTGGRWSFFQDGRTAFPGSIDLNGAALKKSSTLEERTGGVGSAPGNVAVLDNYRHMTLNNQAGTLLTGNFTANFTSVDLPSGYIARFSVFLRQGATGYYPNVFQINGTEGPLLWENGTPPTPTSSAGVVDVFEFLVYGDGLVLGRMRSYS